MEDMKLSIKNGDCVIVSFMVSVRVSEIVVAIQFLMESVVPFAIHFSSSSQLLEVTAQKMALRWIRDAQRYI